MELINGYRFKKRLERAWSYAREGNVTSIRFEGRRVHARVQGTGEDPYKVKLWLDVLNDEDWGYVLEALTQKCSSIRALLTLNAQKMLALLWRVNAGRTTATASTCLCKR